MSPDAAAPHPWWQVAVPGVLAPELGASLGQLTIVAAEAGGGMTGLHRSRRSGSAIEFKEHRRYAPGDDLRRIDWKALGKTDRLHIKAFEDERDLAIYLAVDHSGSMGYGPDGPTKLDKARILAAFLAQVTLRQRDAVGLIGLAGASTRFVPARSAPSHFPELAAALLALEAGGASDFPRCFSELAARVPPMSVVVILSDLLGNEPFEPLLAALAARAIDPILIQVLDPSELSFPFDEPALFVGLEAPRQLQCHPAAVRAAYRAELEAYLARLAQAASRTACGYVRLFDHRSPLGPLTELLGLRRRLAARGGRRGAP